MITDYYSILSVDINADLETIKKAFRKQIALYHPENNKSPEAKEKFDIIIERNSSEIRKRESCKNTAFLWGLFSTNFSVSYYVVV